VGPVDGKEHGVRRPFIRNPWSGHDLAISYTADQDNMAYCNTVVLGKTFKAFWQNITFFKAYDENPANTSFTCHHGVASFIIFILHLC
jgi:hypothetical protein